MSQAVAEFEVIARKQSGKKSSRLVIAVIAALLLIGAAAGWAIYSRGYESTDDAQADGHLNIVSARISGTTAAVYVADNQLVETGQQLVDLDPSEQQVAYAQAKAQYDQAVAKKAQDEATLANARMDLVRYQQLATAKAGSAQQADTQKALVAQLEALVKSDQAAIDNAQATLSYTKIVAPLAGRAGLRQVDQGNIVQPSDSTGVVVITQLQPIAIQFSLPQQQIVRVNAAAAEAPLPVDVFGNDGVTVIDTGKLTGIDNQVDPTTGTLAVRVTFPNPDAVLLPGQFVTVIIRREDSPILPIVPQAAVQLDREGAYVLVVDDRGQVAQRRITPGVRTEKGVAVEQGLKEGERVIVQGIQKVRPGMRVTVEPEAESTPQGAAEG
jgi:multidrug efflux system membrane fusion protein